MKAPRRNVNGRRLECRRWRCALLLMLVTTVALGIAISSGSASETVPGGAVGPMSGSGSIGDLEINGDSTWGEVFEHLDSAEQECIREMSAAGLESALRHKVVHEEIFRVDREVAIHRCLKRETARIILVSVRAELLARRLVRSLDAVEQRVRATDDYGDTLEEAEPVDVGDVGVVVQGSLDYAFDLDVFSFEAEEQGFYVIDVALKTLPDSVVLLFDSDGTRIGRNDDYGRGRGSRMYWTAPAAGSYYVGVGAPIRNSTGSYALTVAFAPTADDDDDHGRSSERATTLTLGEPMAGELEMAHDIDSFVFEAEVGLIYEIEVALGTLPDSFLDLRRFNGRDEVFNDDFGDTRASRIVWKAPQSGRYVASVAGRGTGTYSLTARASAVVDDHGDSGSDATSVALGRSVAGALDHHGDIDVFEFQAEADAFYELDLALGTLSNWIAIVALDSSRAADPDLGAILAYQDEDGGLPDSRLVWQAPASGDAQLQLFGRGQPGTYRLSVRRLWIADDHGNAPSDASRLYVSRVSEGAREYDNDLDVFVFEAEANARYRIDVSPSTLFATHVTLENASRQRLAAERNNAGSRGRPLFWQARESGSYYVVVGGSGRGTYTMSVSEVVDDHANTTAGATSLTIGTAAVGSVDHDYDSDVFAFEARAGVFYEIGVELGTLSDSLLILEGEDGEELDRDDDYQEQQASRIFWHAQSDGQHYVRVRSDTWGRTGSYRLTVTVSQLTDAHANTAAGATVVMVGRPIHSSLEYDDDVDVVAVPAEEGVHYEITLQSETLSDLWARLRTPDGEWLSSTRRPGKEEHPIATFEASVDGEYLVEVHGHGVGTYTLAIDRSDQEDDHSGTQSGATPVTLNQVVNGRVDYPDDDDVFVFRAEQGQVYSISVARRSLPVLLVDAGAYRIHRSRICVSNDPPEVVRGIWAASDSGEYYVMIGGCGWDSIGTYTMTIQSILDDHPDTAEDATVLSPGETMPGAIDHGRDLDVFEFHAEAGKAYEILVVEETLQTARVSAPCNPARHSDSYLEPDRAPTSWTAPLTHAVLVCVSGYGSGSYQIAVSTTD